ncbi:1,2-phenylacetyl-CoA epoxidase subunit PaaD [Chryseolinea soli]|uniref:Phenylacetate-CoA oxygenase subunit PaaJ n=1 Tax=Chryseolinea soli TaxID=2321403 RepID=A0A385SKW6_9BACT|nr:1,2-phenylacetyl-CoA epoxidase subunit PaaD [Chryseolinea soli]AYB32393.1 phenylacetate-CoA oxygenase subunit PaaJ [Chryseolinea soli]
MKPTPATSRDVYTWLEAVKDPEIPVLSLVDLGVITDVVVENTTVDIEMTPTFVGCPALDIMKQEITETLLQRGMTEVRIVVNFRDPWSSDKISEKGRRALKEFGLAPPLPAKVFTDLEVLEHVSCPRCEGTNTTLKNVFGPTLCRSIHYCFDCQESFEQFKPL